MRPYCQTLALAALALAACDAGISGGALNEAEPSAPLDAPLSTAAGPSLALTSSANPAVFSQRVALSAAAAFPGVPTASLAGTMTFLDGATTLGTVAVSSGRATFATRALAVGAHSLGAAFLRTGDTTPVTSAAVVQVVGAADTTTTLASSRPTASYGDAGALTATVKPVAPANAVPTGSADFYVDGGYYLTAPLDGSGKARLALADLYPAYYPGSYSITVEYTGDGSFTGSVAPAPVVQTLVGISAAPVTTVTLNAKGQPSFSPTSFTLSSVNPIGCNVTITNNTPTGIALLYGTPGVWKRLPGGAIAAGASGGVGVSLANFTGYFSAVGAANYVAIHCR